MLSRTSVAELRKKAEAKKIVGCKLLIRNNNKYDFKTLRMPIMRRRAEEEEDGSSEEMDQEDGREYDQYYDEDDDYDGEEEEYEDYEDDTGMEPSSPQGNKSQGSNNLRSNNA